MFSISFKGLHLKLIGMSGADCRHSIVGVAEAYYFELELS